jgi:small conductance mechanosensitive channel
VGNGKVLGDNIQNFTANPYRRVDLVAQLDNGVSHAEATRLLKERLARIPNVAAAPAPDVRILTFTPLGPVLAVRCAPIATTTTSTGARRHGGDALRRRSAGGAR